MKRRFNVTLYNPHASMEITKERIIEADNITPGYTNIRFWNGDGKESDGFLVQLFSMNVVLSVKEMDR